MRILSIKIENLQILANFETNIGLYYGKETCFYIIKYAIYLNTSKSLAALFTVSALVISVTSNIT